MRSRLWLIFIATIFMITYMVGCGKEKKEPISYPVTETVVADIKANSLSEEGIVLVFENKDDTYSIEFGDGQYVIEQRVDKKWCEVTQIIDDIATLDVVYSIGPKKNAEHEYLWIYKYGALSSGKYRLKQIVSKVLYDENGNVIELLGTYCVCVEFTV